MQYGYVIYFERIISKLKIAKVVNNNTCYNYILIKPLRVEMQFLALLFIQQYIFIAAVDETRYIYISEHRPLSIVSDLSILGTNHLKFTVIQKKFKLKGKNN